MKKFFSLLVAGALLTAVAAGTYADSYGRTWNVSPDTLRADVNTVLTTTGAEAFPAISDNDPSDANLVYSAPYNAGTVAIYASGAQGNPYAIDVSLNTAQATTAQAQQYGASCGAIMKVLVPNISVDKVNAAILLDQTVPSTTADNLYGYFSNQVLLTNQIKSNGIRFAAIRYPDNISGIGLVVNNHFLSLDVAPRIVNNRTLVPLRGIFEEIGAEVTWNQATQTATIEGDNKSVTVQIGSKTATIDGKTVNLDTPAQLSAAHGDSRTLVPVRFIAEALGAQVGWVNSPQTVLISNQ